MKRISEYYEINTSFFFFVLIYLYTVYMNLSAVWCVNPNCRYVNNIMRTKNRQILTTSVGAAGYLPSRPLPLKPLKPPRSLL
jgi:hypothetical protein